MNRIPWHAAGVVLGAAGAPHPFSPLFSYLQPYIIEALLSPRADAAGLLGQCFSGTPGLPMVPILPLSAASCSGQRLHCVVFWNNHLSVFLLSQTALNCPSGFVCCQMTNTPHLHLSSLPPCSAGSKCSVCFLHAFSYLAPICLRPFPHEVLVLIPPSRFLSCFFNLRLFEFPSGCACCKAVLQQRKW